MDAPNHYQTLNINPRATAAEIKQAYRSLAKQFHPDANGQDDYEHIIRINAAYEVLSDREQRQIYDEQLFQPHLGRTAQAQESYKKQRQTYQDDEKLFHHWRQKVYAPVDRLLCRIINSLEVEVEFLSADPFDTDLMADFANYLEECRQSHSRAQQIFQHQPNPRQAAGVAADLYHSLNRISEGIDELHWFTLNYDDHHLHTGQELFRIANALRLDAQRSLRICLGNWRF